MAQVAGLLPLWLLVGHGLQCVRFLAAGPFRQPAGRVLARLLCHRRYDTAGRRHNLCRGALHRFPWQDDLLLSLPRHLQQHTLAGQEGREAQSAGHLLSPEPRRPADSQLHPVHAVLLVGGGSISLHPAADVLPRTVRSPADCHQHSHRDRHSTPVLLLPLRWHADPRQ